MTYELCKRLKDAGFPQIGRNGKWLMPMSAIPQRKDNEETTWTTGEEFEGAVYCPDLSELIEACADNFQLFTLCQDYENPTYGEVIRFWTASKLLGTNPEKLEVKKAHGQTPEEAVASLWLELHK